MLFIFVFSELTHSNTQNILVEEIKRINQKTFEALLSFCKMIIFLFRHSISSCLIH